MVLCPVPYRRTTGCRHPSSCNKFSATLTSKVTSENFTSGIEMLDLVPMAVSVVPRRCFRPTNLVWLVDLPSRRTLYQSSKVRNRTQFAVCVPPIFDDGSKNILYDFIEFVAVNRVFGAKRFFFFVETQQAELLSCLRKYRLKSARKQTIDEGKQ